MNWRIGTIRRLPKAEKSIGIVKDISLRLTEYFFDKNIDGFESLVEGKDYLFKYSLIDSQEWVTTMIPLTIESFEKNIDLIGFAHRYCLREWIKSQHEIAANAIIKNFNNRIEILNNGYQTYVNNLMPKKYLVLDNLLDDLKIEFIIVQKHKLYEGTFLLAYYKVSHPTLKIPHIDAFNFRVYYEPFSNHIIQSRFHEEIVSKKLKYEKKIPVLLDKLKNHLIRNFQLEHKNTFKIDLFTQQFKEEIRQSIKEVGVVETRKRQIDIFMLKVINVENDTRSWIKFSENIVPM